MKGRTKLKDKLLSIIIVNYDSPKLIDACLISIDTFLTDIKKEVIIVDNNSTFHNLKEHTQKYPFLKVIYLHNNMGFGYANNIGVKNSKGDVLLILNSDTEFFDITFKSMLTAFYNVESSELWGPRLIWPDGLFQQSYSKEVKFFNFLINYTLLYSFFKKSNIAKNHKYRSHEFLNITEVDIIYGTAFLLNKKDYEKIGGFSNKYFMYFEDLDFCDRFRRDLGGIIKFYPGSTLIHRVQGSSIKKPINLIFFKSKYIYGFRRFGFFLILLILIFDSIMELLKIMVKWIRLVNSRYFKIS